MKANENAEELNCAEQVTIEDILEMSKEVKAEYAEEPEEPTEVTRKTLLEMQLLR